MTPLVPSRSCFRPLLALLVSGIFGLLSFAHFINDLPAQETRASVRDAAEIINFSYWRKYPFREERQLDSSRVSFTYRFPAGSANSTRNAYQEVLDTVITYLGGLASGQSADGSESGVKISANITETSSGGVNQPNIHTVKGALEASSNARKFEVVIHFTRETPVVHADGTRTIHRETIKTERQTFELSGDELSANIVVYCIGSDAVSLADDLFSLR